MRVLIVEDETELRDALVKRFRGAGFAVDAAADGEEGLYLGREFPMDLAIVDLGLPRLNGMDMIRTLREEGRDFPVLILTARDRWQDKVEGLQSGADDYVTKPFHMEEILARANALLRRSAGWSQAMLQCGPIQLDTRSQSVTVGDSAIDLTSFEYKVLEYLMLHAGEVISKSELTEALYEQDFDRDSNTIEVFVGRLRRKLDADGQLKPIETLRGRGYRLALERSAA